MVNPTLVCRGVRNFEQQVTTVTFLPWARAQQIRGGGSVAA
jgi:hypothetical protein